MNERELSSPGSLLWFVVASLLSLVVSELDRRIALLERTHSPVRMRARGRDRIAYQPMQDPGFLAPLIDRSLGQEG